MLSPDGCRPADLSDDVASAESLSSFRQRLKLISLGNHSLVIFWTITNLSLVDL